MKNCPPRTRLGVVVGTLGAALLLTLSGAATAHAGEAPDLDDIECLIWDLQGGR
jgi:hypothetical protein